MLTITPPETRVDEIQVDETERDSILLKLSPTRVKAKRKARNAHGFNYIQLIVGMIIFVALSRIVGPPAFRMITRARSTALEANIQTAAETVRNVLAIDPASRGDMSINTDGAPTESLLAALTDDAPFNWTGTWALAETDDSDTVKIQLLAKAAADAPTATTPPDVDWLLNSWDAIRIHARNQDGAWACALIVLKPDVDELDTVTSGTSADVVLIDGQDAILAAANVGNRVTVPLGNARLRGIWYDAGETYGSDNGLNHCSPISTGTVAQTCDGAAGTTAEACHNAGGANIPAAPASGTDYSPLPGGADLWGITTDRVLTRNP